MDLDNGRSRSSHRLRTSGLLLITALVACSSGGSGATPTREQWVILADDTGSNVSAFEATSVSSSLQSTIPQLGASSTLGTDALGEIHFANGKAFVTISSGLTGPTTGLPSGGLAIYDIGTQQVERTVVLESTLTGKQSRFVHTYVDPEAKHLWVNNDGPSGDPADDSVFRVNIDPTDMAGYLRSLEIVTGNGHHKTAFSRPSSVRPNARRYAVDSNLTAQSFSVIDDEPSSPTYGNVVKTITTVGASPHGAEYSPVSGHVYEGITGGGVVILDASSPDLSGKPSFDCANNNDCNAPTVDASVSKISAGTGSNQIPKAGYVHVRQDGNVVYTVGYDSTAHQGYLSAIDAAHGDAVILVLPLGDMAASSIQEKATDKLYIPSNATGAQKDVIAVVDIDPASPTYHTLLRKISVGAAAGDRNGRVSPDGRLAVYPNTSTNTVSVIDTATDVVIDTLTTPGVASSNVAIVHLPIDANDNR